MLAQRTVGHYEKRMDDLSDKVHTHIPTEECDMFIILCVSPLDRLSDH